MSTLSDLLPAGAGGKNVSFIAEGTLSNGQTVALRSDGKVEAIAQTSQATGSPLQWGPSTATYLSATPYGSVYDPDSQRVIVAYYDGNNNYYGYCVVGEVDPSNNTITFGTPAMFQQNFVIVHSIGYDTTNDKVVVFSQNVNAGSAGQAKVGVVSGNSISFPSSPTAFNSSSTEDITAVFNPDEGNFLVVYKNNGNSGRPEGVVGTVTGTTISFGVAQQADSATASYLALTYNTTTNRYVFIYNDNNSTNVAVQLPTTSGSTVTFGGAVAYVSLNGSTSVQSDYTNLVSDDASNTVFIITANTSNSRYPSAIAATIPTSGNTITFGTEVFFNGSSRVYSMGAAWDSNAKKLVISYADANQYGNVVAASVSGTTLTFGSPSMFRTALTGSLSNAFDSSANRILVTYTENNTGYAGAVVFSAEVTNVNNFIGITDAAISNASTGNVTIKGGIATAQLASPVFAYNNQSFSVASQSSLPEEVRFKPDGTKFYILGGANDQVYQYSMSTAWDVTTASYDNVSLNVQTQDTNPQGLAINADGTSFYMCGQTDSIYQYDLTSAYDLSTASYANKSFSFAGQIGSGTPWGIHFNSSGTQLYMISSSASGPIYQYSLSSAFDVSTASYANKTVNAGLNNTTSLTMTPNGVTLYVLDYGSGIYKYTLSVADDISTATYDNVFYDVTAQDTQSYGVAVKTDNTQLYITGAQNDSVYQYSLSSNLTPNSVYYVANDGTISTTSTGLRIGKALSASSINLEFET